MAASRSAYRPKKRAAARSKENVHQLRKKEMDQMSTTMVPALDMNKLNAFIGQFVTDLGAAQCNGHGGHWREAGTLQSLVGEPLSSSQLAAKTKTDERYLREWLASQAAGGYVTYDEKNDKFSLSEEQAFALATEDSPAYLPGAFELALGSLAAVPRIAESFRTGAGYGLARTC